MAEPPMNPTVSNINVTDSGTGVRTSDSNIKGLKEKAKKIGEEKMDKKKKEQLANAEREKLLASRNQQYVLNYLERKTRFDKEQIRALQKMYRSFKPANQKDMDRLRFREMVASMLGITDNVMLDRIFNAFDGDNEGSVSESEWIIGLSVQLRGTLDQQTAYAYDVYDFNGDRGLGRDELYACLQKAIHVVPGVLDGDEIDDATNELVELAMKKFDIDRDMSIRFSEYRHVVRNDPLLLEALGECLPNEKAAMGLTALLDANPRNYSFFLSPPGDAGWAREKLRYQNYKPNAYQEGYIQDPSADEGQSVSPIGSSMLNFPPKKDQVKPPNHSKDKRKSTGAPRKSLGV